MQELIDLHRHNAWAIDRVFALAQTKEQATASAARAAV